uniref:Uncharacterized protein n=1 Tax=Timema poppense TaxID=170557 RepID=A0A7R9H246_TIMPO|nr:unnamed protein product [Timema poppensis]
MLDGERHFPHPHANDHQGSSCPTCCPVCQANQQEEKCPMGRHKEASQWDFLREITQTGSASNMAEVPVPVPVRLIVHEEGRTARNLIAFNVPMEPPISDSVTAVLHDLSSLVQHEEDNFDSIELSSLVQEQVEEALQSKDVLNNLVATITESVTRAVVKELKDILDSNMDEIKKLREEIKKRDVIIIS